MVKQKKEPYEGEPTQEFAVVPGPAEEAEGTIHPAEDLTEEIPQSEPEPESEPASPEGRQSTEVIVDQVIRGEWGIGQDRRLRLHRAGYDPNKIQKELVNRANHR